MRDDHTIRSTGATPLPLGEGEKAKPLPSIDTWQPPKVWTKAAGQHSADSTQLRDIVARNALPGTATKLFAELGAQSAQALVGLVGLAAISQKEMHHPMVEALISVFPKGNGTKEAVTVMAQALKQGIRRGSGAAQVQHGKNIDVAMRLLTKKPTLP
jgi:hypothetical protein